MSHWNYRMVCETVTHLGVTEDVWTVREVFYDDDRNVQGWSAEPVAPQADTKIDLMDDLGKMSAAASFPPLYVVGDRLEMAPANGRDELK